MSPYVDTSDLEDDWTNAKAGDFDIVPDGEYLAEIQQTRFSFTKSNKDRLFEWKFVITEGPERGALVKKAHLLRKELLGWLKSDVKRLGLTFESLADLQQNQKDLWELSCRIRLVTKPDKQGKDRQNIYILGIPEAAQSPNVNHEPPPPEDDIPF